MTLDQIKAEILNAQVAAQLMKPGTTLSRCVLPKNYMDKLVGLPGVDMYNKKIWGYRLEFDDVPGPMWV